MSRIGQIVVCLLLAGGAFLVIRWINETEPTAQREGATKETAMLVDVTSARQDDFDPEIVVLGTVEPERDVQLRPRVAGHVLERGKNFVPGGFVDHNETLLLLDPTDFTTEKLARAGEHKEAEAQHDQAKAEVTRIEAEVEQVKAERLQAEAELEQAQADLEVEQGRQIIARRDYELLEDRLDPQQKRLALREPQLAAARARIEVVRTKIKGIDAKLAATKALIEGAKASVAAASARVETAKAASDQAVNDADRATVTAPFKAQVLERMADRGSEVSTSNAIARLVGVEKYWVVATVPLAQLRWIRFAKGEEPGSTVYIHHDAAWGKDKRRKGHVERLVGTLDRTTRLARILIVVKDPLALEEDADPDPEYPDRPPLIVGSLVEARIQGETLPQVVRLDRAYLRKDRTVWVMSDDKLDIRKVSVIFQDKKYAYVEAGLEGGERIVMTDLATVAPGAPLRTVKKQPVRADGDKGGQKP